MYVEVLTCTCHNPTCLGFLRNGRYRWVGQQTNCLLPRGSISLLECGQLLEPIFITFPIIGIKSQQFNPGTELGTLQSFTARQFGTFGYESACDVSRNFNNQSVYVLSAGNKQNFSTKLKKIEGWLTSAGEMTVQQESGPIPLVFFCFFCALQYFCLLSLHPKYSCPTMFPLFMCLNEYAGFAPVPSCQTNLANLP